jgi:riboflavin biosynthesis pyrimidine reductase
MTVTVTLVVGADGSTSKHGSSAGVSSAADKSAFLERRRSADCILIGGNTARTEPYQRTPVPVVVLSRSLVNPLPGNHRAHIWNLNPIDAIARAQKNFGSILHIEAGAEIINTLLEANAVDVLELSITDVTGGDDPIDIEKLLSYFSHKSEKVVDGTRLISASR